MVAKVTAQVSETVASEAVSRASADLPGPAPTREGMVRERGSSEVREVKCSPESKCEVEVRLQVVCAAAAAPSARRGDGEEA